MNEAGFPGRTLTSLQPKKQWDICHNLSNYNAIHQEDRQGQCQGRLAAAPPTTGELERRGWFPSYYFQRLTPAPLQPLMSKLGSQDPFPSIPALPLQARVHRKEPLLKQNRLPDVSTLKIWPRLLYVHACSQIWPKMSTCRHQIEKRV